MPGHKSIVISVRMAHPPTIELGVSNVDFALTADRGSTVTWVMNPEQHFPFAVKFDPRSDLQANPRSAARDMWDATIPADLPEHLIYKYTVAVCTDPHTVLILDPVLVPIPPEN